jgi:hypothetical protein
VAAVALSSIALALVVLKSGVWLMPNLPAQFAVSQSLTRNGLADAGSHYLYGTYLQPVVFGVLGPRSFAAYAAYCGLLTLAFAALLFAAFFTTHGVTWKALGLATFAVVMVPLYWVGMDGLTLLLVLAVVLTLHTPWSWLPAVLLSWQHFEHGFVAFAILALTIAVAGRTLVLRLVLIVLGALLAGKGALVGYFALVGIHVAQTRAGVMHANLTETMLEWRSSWPIILWSLGGAGWIIVLAAVRRAWPVLVAAVAALLVLMTTSDHTRTGSILLFPALLYWLILDRSLWAGLRPVWIAAALLAYVSLPVVYVWAGVPCGSVRGHTARQLRAGFDLSRVEWMTPFLEPGTAVCPPDQVDRVIRRLRRSP